MRTPQQISPETIASMAKQLVDLEIPPADHQSVAELLNALSVEMQPMRKMDVGGQQPAPTFEALEND